MKKIHYILLAALLTSCVGQKEPVTNIAKFTIAADQPYVSVDNGEQLPIRVKRDGVDVTADSELFYTDGESETSLENGIFSATQSGEYTIQARYEGEVVESQITLRAYEDSELTGKFFRRNLVMKFTGTWCTNCPAMGAAIGEVEHERPFRLVEIALHSNDKLQIDATKEFIATYNYDLPATVVDMNTSATIYRQSPDIIKSGLDSSISSNPTVAGVRVSSEINGSNIKIEVGATVQSAGKYKIAVAVVRDTYDYPQTGASDPNYKQDKVLRSYLTDKYGDSISDLEVNTEKVFTYNASLPEGSPKAECRVVAYILNEQADGNYLVNNATEVLAGSSVGYIYEL